MANEAMGLFQWVPDILQAPLSPQGASILTCEVYGDASTTILIVRNELHYEEIGARGSVVVKAICYKPEGRGFETR
jgi:hypothetical protein